MKTAWFWIRNELTGLYRSLRVSIEQSYRNAPAPLQKLVRRGLGGLLLLVVAIIVFKVASTAWNERQLKAELAKGPHVRTARAENAKTERVVEILGEASPYASVTLYAKVSGYLKSVKVDKGDVVKKGAVLAVIESPESDRAYDAAKADMRNKKAIADRMQKLLDRQLISQQEAEQSRSDADVAIARFESQAVVRSYSTLRAPFDGTITARMADPGALVQNAMNSQTSALPVVEISQINKLRVYVYLDQRDALSVEKGQKAEISLRENPDAKFEGTVTRVAGGLDSRTRMMLTEIELDNSENKIVAGSLVQVKIHLSAAPGLTVPAEALVLRDNKTTVPIVTSENEILYRVVKVIENDGERIKIAEGLQAGETVALNLGNTLSDHAKVRPNDAEAPAGAKK